MRQLYEQVRVDDLKMSFYAECPICGKRQYAGRLLLLCRNKAMLEQLELGLSGKFRQKAYNNRKASAVRYLARFFNLCRSCGKWVCDGCYDINDDFGICWYCKTHGSESQQDD